MGIGWAFAELENSKCPGDTPEDLRTHSGRKSSAAEKGKWVSDGHLRNWKTANAQEIPQKIYGRIAAGNLLQRRKGNGYRMGICGTGIERA